MLVWVSAEVDVGVKGHVLIEMERAVERILEQAKAKPTKVYSTATNL